MFGTTPLSIARDILGEEKAHEFSVWALGEDYYGTPLKDVPNIYNKRHKTQILVSDPIRETTEKMIKDWENER